MISKEEYFVALSEKVVNIEVLRCKNKEKTHATGFFAEKRC